MKQKDEKPNGHEASFSNGKNHSKASEVETMPKTKNKCDLGPNFVAPDGGWAWMILIGAGCSNVSQYSSTLTT